MAYIPMLDRLLCTVPDAGTVIGHGRTKTYELIKKKIIETVDVDGRQMVVVASLKKLAVPDTASEQKVAA